MASCGRLADVHMHRPGHARTQLPPGTPARRPRRVLIPGLSAYPHGDSHNTRLLRMLPTWPRAKEGRLDGNTQARAAWGTRKNFASHEFRRVQMCTCTTTALHSTALRQRKGRAGLPREGRWTERGLPGGQSNGSGPSSGEVSILQGKGQSQTTHTISLSLPSSDHTRGIAAEVCTVLDVCINHCFLLSV